jgi:hypothetical protein
VRSEEGVAVIDWASIRNDESWWEGGFEIQLRFEKGGMRPDDPQHRKEFLSYVAGSVFYSRPQDIGIVEAALSQWDCDTQCYCLGRVGNLGVVAAYLWPQPQVGHLLMLIPFTEVRRIAPDVSRYSWDLSDLRSVCGVSSLHLQLIAWIRDLHQRIPLRAALLKMDCWRGQLQVYHSGLFIRDEVAHALRCEGPYQDALCRLEL